MSSFSRSSFTLSKVPVRLRFSTLPYCVTVLPMIFEKSPQSFAKVGDQVYDRLFVYAGLGPEMKDQDYSSPAAHAAIGSIRDGSAFRDSMYADGIDRYFR